MGTLELGKLRASCTVRSSPPDETRKVGLTEQLVVDSQIAVGQPSEDKEEGLKINLELNKINK